MSIYSIITELASNNSRLFKEAVLKREIDNETLKRVFFLALDPLTQFYIRKIPKYTKSTSSLIDDSITLEEGLVKLDALINRDITGHAAVNHLSNVLSKLDEEDAKVVELIIGKDLKCGVSTATVNKTWKSLVSDVPYMRCSLLKDMKPGVFENGGISQIKADGMFANLDLYSDSKVKLYSRGGNAFDVDGANFFSLIAMARARLQADTQTHGELLVMEGDQVLPREIGNGILNSVLKGGDFGPNQKPIFEVWDQIPLSAAVPGGSYHVPYKERFQRLCEQIVGIVEITPIETKYVSNIGQAYEHYFDAVGRGLEGTIIKLENAIWEDKTSQSQFKVKVEFDCDLKITGFNPGKGKNEQFFGSIACQSEDGLLKVNVSGFKDKPKPGILTREQIHNMREELLGTILTVKSNNIMRNENKANSLFLPRAVEFRTDKTIADDMQRIEDAFQSALLAKQVIKDLNGNA